MTTPNLMACIIEQMVAHYGPAAVFRAVLKNEEVAEAVVGEHKPWRIVTHPSPTWDYNWTLRPGLDTMISYDDDDQRPEE